MGTATHCCAFCGCPTARRDVAGDVRLTVALRDGSRIEHTEKICRMCSASADALTIAEACDALQAAVEVLTRHE